MIRWMRNQQKHTEQVLDLVPALYATLTKPLGASQNPNTVLQLLCCSLTVWKALKGTPKVKNNENGREWPWVMLIVRLLHLDLAFSASYLFAPE